MHPSLAAFHPVIQQWFVETFGDPTPPQAQGWPLIASGQNVLLLAPTGSGKTLAAFLNCLDWLLKHGQPAETHGVQVLYVSPLKALNNDIHRNLQEPLAGLAVAAERLGQPNPKITAAVRTGDTPSAERQRMLRKPPQILITTPESLFLMISSKARSILRTVRFVIIDEIHTLFPEKRGAHLAVTLERLQHLVGDEPLQRIGLSATMRPLEAVAEYLGGAHRPVAIVDAGHRKNYDLAITLPVPDLRSLPERTIWPDIYRTLHHFIQQHRTTLVFVNNRRLAERITANLNKLAAREIARTHHGSISKEMRLVSEDQLKSGAIPCIVATSSLELGIDVGYIDLVVQIESPKDVARGMQRVGRAGHVLTLPSKGRLVPKTRMDLLESAVMLQQMQSGRVDAIRAPRNCLDILAQQLVAMTTEQDWTPQQMFAVVRRSYTMAELTWEDFLSTLAMAAGVYETEQYVQLRPRLHWDRTRDVVSADPYGVRLVYTNGGTIPQRGYFGVYLADSKIRLGELDEEFVYERRLGERFVLGTSTWRIEEIRQDRVVVSRARSQEPNIPFWKGQSIGRSYHFGAHFGAFLREAEEHVDTLDFGDWLRSVLEVTDAAVIKNLEAFIKQQKHAVGRLPSDRCLVLEEFLDVGGQWHMLLHSPYGTKVHTLLGLLLQKYIREQQQVQIEVLPTDNGILFHAPGSRQAPQLPWAELPVHGLEAQAAELLAGTSLFGITFRHCAQRSLVLSLTGYGQKRTPLWLSRLKASDLLQVVSAVADFPLVKEAYREILNDYFDLDQLQELIQRLHSRDLTVHRVRRETPSPFAQEHLFAFEGMQMYTEEAPRGQSTSTLLGVKAGTLRDLVSQGGFRQQLRPEVIARVEARAQGLDGLRRQPSLERAQYWLERIGDVQFREVDPQLQPLLAELESQGIAEARELAGNPSWIASLHRERYRQGDVAWILTNYSRTRGPFTSQTLVKRYGLEQDAVEDHLQTLAAQGQLERGRFHPESDEEHWLASVLLRDIHQQSLRQQRRELDAAAPAAYAQFLRRWQHCGQPLTDVEGLQAVLEQLAYLWLPAQDWEASVLPQRVQSYSGQLLDQLLASGLVVWRSRQSGSQFLVRFEPVLTAAPNQQLPDWVPNSEAVEDLASAALSRGAQDVLHVLQERGALGLVQISRALDQSLTNTWPALEELLIWGRITNDSFGPMRLLWGLTGRQRRDPRFFVQPKVLAQLGRFSVLPTQVSHTNGHWVQRLLRRWGVVSREMAAAEGLAWGEVFPVLDYLENIGEIRRGYLVDGLSGVQFVEDAALQSLTTDVEGREAAYWVLAKDDPANTGRVFQDSPHLGSLTAYCEGRAVIGTTRRKLLVPQDVEAAVVHGALPYLLSALYPYYGDSKIQFTHVNDLPITESSLAEPLRALGFEPGYQELTLWPSQRPVL